MDPAIPQVIHPPTRELPLEDNGLSLRERIERVEREILADALAAHGGNQSRVARNLNISRVTLAAKIRKYQLRAEPDVRDAEGETPPPGTIRHRASNEPQ